MTYTLTISPVLIVASRVLLPVIISKQVEKEKSPQNPQGNRTFFLLRPPLIHTNPLHYMQYTSQPPSTPAKSPLIYSSIQMPHTKDKPLTNNQQQPLPQQA
jgi:hypothetical protein